MTSEDLPHMAHFFNTYTFTLYKLYSAFASFLKLINLKVSALRISPFTTHWRKSNSGLDQHEGE